MKYYYSCNRLHILIIFHFTKTVNSLLIEFLIFVQFPLFFSVEFVYISFPSPNLRKYRDTAGENIPLKVSAVQKP